MLRLELLLLTTYVRNVKVVARWTEKKIHGFPWGIRFQFEMSIPQFYKLWKS